MGDRLTGSGVNLKKDRSLRQLDFASIDLVRSTRPRIGIGQDSPKVVAAARAAAHACGLICHAPTKEAA